MRTLLLLLALLPPIFLMYRVYKADKVEKEPVSLVLKLFLLGAVVTVFAGLIENFAGKLIRIILSEKSFAYRIIFNFVVVAWSEEGLKHTVLKRISWRRPEFNYRFDAIVYAVAVSLGFAAFENIGYVFSYGFYNALGRAVTAVPSHCVFGIFMGYYYGVAKYCAVRKSWRKESIYQFLSLLVPLLMHGTYDFTAASAGSGLSAMFLIYIVVIDVVALVMVGRMSRNDSQIREEYDEQQRRWP